VKLAKRIEGTLLEGRAMGRFELRRRYEVVNMEGSHLINHSSEWQNFDNDSSEGE
jgi:hypothetical protein